MADQIRNLIDIYLTCYQQNSDIKAGLIHCSFIYLTFTIVESHSKYSGKIDL